MPEVERQGWLEACEGLEIGGKLCDGQNSALRLLQSLFDLGEPASPDLCWHEVGLGIVPSPVVTVALDMRELPLLDLGLSACSLVHFALAIGLPLLLFAIFFESAKTQHHATHGGEHRARRAIDLAQDALEIPKRSAAASVDET